MPDLSPRLLLRPWRSSAFRIQALALLVCTLAIAAVVLMRGELDPTGYEQELTLLQDYLKAEGHPHFLGFLEAWTSVDS